MTSEREPDDLSPLLEKVRALQRSVRDHVLEACRSRALEQLARVDADDRGDTIYAIDRVGEEALVAGLEVAAAEAGGIVLVAEGIAGGALALPRGSDPLRARWRVIVDPIDGTRGLMYQKRSAWVLAGIAPNRGSSTRLSDVLAAAQIEIPILKQNLSDELWAIRGQGAHAIRHDHVSGRSEPLSVTPSRASNIEHGFATVVRFFPGARDELASIDEEVVRAAAGAPQPGKALCFEDQYASSGGQLYELACGHDRFVADLRPLMHGLQQRRGEPPAMCCHPYDVCTLLIAEELGVIVTDPRGSPLDAPLDLETDVAWVGYANEAIRARVEPGLRAALIRRGMIEADARPREGAR